MTVGPPSAVLAFDYGEKRIGVATGNTLTSTAQPLTTLRAVAGVPDWPAVARCIEQWRPDLVVVGVPYNMDGSDGRLTAAARLFAQQLETRFGVEVATVDERLSSREAETVLREQRRAGTLGRRIRREDVDSQAACVLLRQWLDAR